MGYTPGDESVVVALTSDQVQTRPPGDQVACIGCHTSTPDGKFAAFKTLDNTGTSINGGILASVQSSDAGAPPPFWTTASINSLNTSDFGVPSFSKAHWTEGDYTMLSSLGNSGSGSGAQLAWFDLEATANALGTAYGYLPVENIVSDAGAMSAIMPNFTHDGLNVVFTSTSETYDGRVTGKDAKVYVVPYNSRAGGTATAILGASDPAYDSYYPAVSPDDSWIAFNRIPAGSATDSEQGGNLGEVFVVPIGGGTPTRLAANDPIACLYHTSPGITNSWPKWAPKITAVGDRTFYWLVFSSKRVDYQTSQLYLTAVVLQGNTVQTYPALLLWPQPPTKSNHTPAWDYFEIPKAPPPVEK